MPSFIVLQPNGCLAIWSGVCDDFSQYNIYKLSQLPNSIDLRHIYYHTQDELRKEYGDKLEFLRVVRGEKYANEVNDWCSTPCYGEDYEKDYENSGTNVNSDVNVNTDNSTRQVYTFDFTAPNVPILELVQMALNSLYTVSDYLCKRNLSEVTELMQLKMDYASDVLKLINSLKLGNVHLGDHFRMPTIQDYTVSQTELSLLPLNDEITDDSTELQVNEILDELVSRVAAIEDYANDNDGNKK